MKSLIYILIGAMSGTVIYSCAMGGNPRFNSFPVRSKENSVWMKCLDGDKLNACKYVCTKYKRNNKCKKDHEKVERLNIQDALNNGSVLISNSFFQRLIRAGK